ncbi:MAG: hypothetical protein ACLU6Z_02785 [Odoribacter splanchnicus]
MVSVYRSPAFGSGTVSKFTEQDRLWFGDPEGNRLRQAELLQLMSRAGISALNPETYTTGSEKILSDLSECHLTSYYDQSIEKYSNFIVPVMKSWAKNFMQ